MAHGSQREIGKQPQCQQRRNAPTQEEPMVGPSYAAVQPNTVLVLFDNARGTHLAVIGPWWDILPTRLARQTTIALVRVLAVRYQNCRLRIPIAQRGVVLVLLLCLIDVIQRCTNVRFIEAEK